MRTAAIVLIMALTTTACGGSGSTETTGDPSTTATTEFVPGTLPDHLLADWFTPETGLAMKFPVDWLSHEEVENGFVGFTAPPSPAIRSSRTSTW